MINSVAKCTQLDAVMSSGAEALTSAVRRRWEYALLSAHDCRRSGHALDRDNLGPQVVSHLGRSADADQMRKYWTHLWDYAELGIFTVREQHYLEAKQRLDAARGEQRKYNALELAGEEGATCYFGPAIVVLLPQLTWDGFKRGDRQKTGTPLHELTHAEDQS